MTPTTMTQLSMPSRNTSEINMGLEVKVQTGYCLKFDLVNNLANSGMVLLTSEGLTEGAIKLSVVNQSRHIVVVRPGEPFVRARLEKITKLEWE